MADLGLRGEIELQNPYLHACILGVQCDLVGCDLDFGWGAAGEDEQLGFMRCDALDESGSKAALAHACCEDDFPAYVVGVVGCDGGCEGVLTIIRQRKWSHDG